MSIYPLKAEYILHAIEYITKECSVWDGTVSEFSQFIQGAYLSYDNANADQQQTCVRAETGFNPKNTLVTHHSLGLLEEWHLQYAM